MKWGSVNFCLKYASGEYLRQVTFDSSPTKKILAKFPEIIQSSVSRHSKQMTDELVNHAEYKLGRRLTKPDHMCTQHRQDTCLIDDHGVALRGHLRAL